jgi:hypothetical protein
MVVRGQPVDEPGRLETVLTVGNEPYLVTTIFVKYHYEVSADGNNELQGIYIVCLPNGMLQDAYNPDVNHTIWKVGRNAPTLGEDFRVRIGFGALKALTRWRVQHIHILPTIRVAALLGTIEAVATSLPVLQSCPPQALLVNYPEALKLERSRSQSPSQQKARPPPGSRAGNRD